MNSHPSANRYIDRLKLIPLLERSEELELTTRYAKSRDRAARDRLVDAHQRYVVAVAYKYRRDGLLLDDLIAEGNLGVLHALEKFAPERGYRFVTYAQFWIRAYVFGYVARSRSIVDSGALRSKAYFKLRRERARLSNGILDDEEMAKELGQRLAMSPKRILELTRRVEERDVSLQTRVGDESSDELIDSLPSAVKDVEQAVFEGYATHTIADAVRQSLTLLDSRERFVVEHRLMADQETELSLREIGRALGVSRERARQLEARAKRKLAARLFARSAEPGGDWLGLNGS